MPYMLLSLVYLSLVLLYQSVLLPPAFALSVYFILLYASKLHAITTLFRISRTPVPIGDLLRARPAACGKQNEAIAKIGECRHSCVEDASKQRGNVLCLARILYKIEAICIRIKNECSCYRRDLLPHQRFSGRRTEADNKDQFILR